MNFGLTEEQAMLSDTVRRLMDDQYGFEQRKLYQAAPLGWSEALWQTYAGLGLLGFHLPEGEGGFASGPVEVMLVATQLGRALALEPWISTVVTGGSFLRYGAATAESRDALNRIADGSVRVAFAQAERGIQFDLGDVTATAVRDGDGWIVDGEKIMVLHGDSATHFVVSARVGGQRREQEGIAILLVPASTAGVTCTGFAQVDAQRAANVRFDKAKVSGGSLLATPGDGIRLMQRVVNATVAAMMAEAVGCMEGALALTSDYLKNRCQFGRPIGDYQALQHRAADMVVALEQSRSAAVLAAMALMQDDPVETQRGVSAAKIEVARNSKIVGEQAIQLHGGMGMAMEYAVGHYLKRLTVINNTFGNRDYHLALLAQIGGAFAIG